MNLGQLKNVVAFAILMESEGGILSKSPDYIEEKFSRYCHLNLGDRSEWGLDGSNKLKLAEWLEQWKDVITE